MGRLFIGASAVEVALVIIGVTWIGPQGTTEQSPEARVAAQSEVFRTEGLGTGNIVEVELDATETTQEIAEGVDYRVWTFGGTAPGPVIRVTEGDTVRFNLTNNTTVNLSHSIDFHAAQTPWDVNYQPVPPGETLTFDWVARFPGVFMYHCGVPPVLEHIANGMYGAIIVEPKEAPEPAREYVVVSSEFYPTSRSVDGAHQGDLDRMSAVDPEYVVFNGFANRYLDAPLEARPNELVRLWVMNAGPTLDNAFHVIGALFDHVYPDGNPTNAINGMQTWSVPPGGGAMFELRVPDEGLYPFVNHSFAYTGLGALGVLKISESASPAPSEYPRMASPFEGGLTETSGLSGQVTPVDTTPAEDDEGGGGGDAIALEAAINGFTPASIDAAEGAVAIEMTNADPMPHDFTIDELDIQEAVEADGVVSFSFEATTGTYTFYCSIPGHREAGMEGELTVMPAAAH
jgi:nitrite reductase (NO-forming)